MASTMDLSATAELAATDTSEAPAADTNEVVADIAGEPAEAVTE